MSSLQIDVLVLSAHPDDAELAIGGLIASLTDNGHKVMIVNFTVSEVNEEARQKRKKAAAEAAQILGAQLGWASEGKYDQVGDMPDYVCVKEVDRIVQEYNPKIVISHSDIDSHADHIKLARAVLASSRRWNADIYAFGPNEYRSPVYHDFAPNFFVDTSKFIGKKCAAIECYNYNSQNFRSLQSDNIKKLDAAMGMFNGYEYGEGLKIIRKRGFYFL